MSDAVALNESMHLAHRISAVARFLLGELIKAETELENAAEASRGNRERQIEYCVMLGFVLCKRHNNYSVARSSPMATLGDFIKKLGLETEERARVFAALRDINNTNKTREGYIALKLLRIPAIYQGALTSI